MTESPKKPPKNNSYKKLLVFPKALWEAIEAKAKEESVANLNEFIRYICREYLKSEGFRNRPEKDEELFALQKERSDLLTQEYEFVANLNSLLKTAKKEAKPLDYEKKIAQILKCVESQRLKFDEIAEATNILKEELIVIIGNLVENESLGFDEQWRYYQL